MYQLQQLFFIYIYQKSHPVNNSVKANKLLLLLLLSNLWECEGVTGGCAGLAHISVEAGHTVGVGQTAWIQNVIVGQKRRFYNYNLQQRR